MQLGAKKEFLGVLGGSLRPSGQQARKLTQVQELALQKALAPWMC